MSNNTNPVRPWDLFLKKERANEEIKQKRLSICQECPEFIKLTKQCKKCGCFMEQKVKLPEATCPLLKWGPDQYANISIISNQNQNISDNNIYSVGKNGKDSFYHLHIPKTGGTYIREHMTRFLSNNLKENNIKEIVAHDGWTHVTPTTYVLTTLRDPAKRTVSHFAFYLLVNGYFNNPEYTNDIIKKMFLEWLDRPENNYIRNFQSKNLFFVKSSNNHSFSKEDLHINTMLEDGFLFDKQKDFISINLSDKDILSRAKSIDMIIQDKDLNDHTCFMAIEEICKSFGFEYKDNPVFFPNSFGDNINEKSEILFSLLSKQEIDNLYRINNLDSELYFTDSIYWRP